MASRWLSIACALLCAGAAAAQGGAPVKSINKRSFPLPFEVKSRPGERVTELRLFVQRQGGPWELHTTSAPDARGIPFRAEADGVYAFTVQTVDSRGRLDPPATADLRAMIRVRVDTRPPTIEVEPVPGTPGTAGVSWDVRDDEPAPTSLLCQGRFLDSEDGKAAQWMDLGIDGPKAARGEAFWTLAGRRMEVRVTCRDKAGNLGESRYVTLGGDGPGGGAGGTGEAAPPRRGAGYGAAEPFYVASRSVKLDTRIRTGKSGLSEVKLWVKPEGKSWEEVKGGLKEIPGGSSAQPNPDGTFSEKRQIAFRADDDGRYGFLIASKSRVGLAERGPAPTDAPRVQVVIDTVNPVVRLAEAKVIPNGERGNHLSIAWTAEDANLVPYGVDLFYAPAPPGGGPLDAKTAQWKILAEKRDKSGTYLWPVPNAEPYQFYVKVRAADRAGNFAEHVWSEPLTADMVTPRSEIIEVLPAEPGKP